MKRVDMMGRKRYYTSGELARRVNVTIRTIRYYDKQGILKPNQVNEVGYRLYTGEDFGWLQKIPSLKYLGFLLEEIMTVTINDEVEDITHSLDLQGELTEKRIRHLQVMAQTLNDATRMLGESRYMDQNGILNPIHITNMEYALVDRYKTAVSLDVGIKLRRRFSHNPTSWFPWLLSQMELGTADSILEVGCGNGELWQEAELDSFHRENILLTDIPAETVEDASGLLKNVDARQEVLHYAIVDYQKLPHGGASFDRVIVNHVFFYVKNLNKVLEEINRVMREDGVFCCNAYGREHIKEITSLVQGFDSRITLSKVALYELFGPENGQEMLEGHFDPVEKVLYDDYLTVGEAEPLLDYILSCHSSQSEILSQRQLDFKSFLQKKMGKHGCIHIIRIAGIFICRKCTQSQ